MTRKQKYFLKQKLAGVISILMSIVFTILCDGDATICLLMVPVGIVLIFTKEMVMFNKDYYIINREEYKEESRS